MSRSTAPSRVVIMGAAGRDFHNFNVVFRDDPSVEVLAFTAAQIPNITNRRYPPGLAGDRYPDGIPIVDESELVRICRTEHIDQVIFAYSDVSYDWVMHRSSLALAAGADFVLLGPRRTMLAAQRPVIAVNAVRTGCGKSQTTRWLAQLLRTRGLDVAVIRHPMPYGDLDRQAVQRFATRADLDAANCTVEEREEYEPHIALGSVVYAGVDYGKILARAQKEADVILWDGGNNDFPFIRPDLQIVLVDPLRPGHEAAYHPGEAVLRTADIIVVTKTNAASAADISRVSESARRINREAVIIRATSPVVLDDADAVRNRRVLVVEDGPTLTHGGMAYGAGFVAATEAGAAEIVDPRANAVEAIAAVYAEYPHISRVLPAVGYNPLQLRALEATITASDAEVIVSATPCDLDALLTVDKPIVRARYEFAEADEPRLSALVTDFLDSRSER